MKYIYIILIMLLILPKVIAVETQVDISADVYFEVIGDKGNLRLIFEGYDSIYRPSLLLSYDIEYIETTEIIDNSTNETIWTFVASIANSNEILSTTPTKIGFTMVREFGNSSELFDIINTCNEMANFSNLWVNCRDKYDVLFESTTYMINQSLYEEIENNLTQERDKVESDYETLQISSDTEIKNLKTRIGTLEKHRQIGWGMGIIGIGVSIYLANKYTGFGKRKHQEQTEFPKDTSV